MQAELVPALAGAHTVITTAVVVAIIALVATCYLARRHVADFAARLRQKYSAKKTCTGSTSSGPTGVRMPIRLAIASASHIGKKRTSQQDKVRHTAKRGIVCDGMGGAGADGSGEIAAEVALNAVDNTVAANEPTTRAEARKLVREAVLAGNRAVLARTAAEPALKGMGSTILLGCFVEDHAVTGSLGDSRGYHLTGGVLTQVTKDHSLAQALVDLGKLTPAQAEQSRFRHVLTRFGGSTDHPDDQGDLVETLLQAGDRFLLCSDGIDKELQPPEIAKILASSDDPEVICQALIDAANAKGGCDNIGVVVVVVS